MESYNQNVQNPFQTQHFDETPSTVGRHQQVICEVQNYNKNYYDSYLVQQNQLQNEKS